MSAESPIIHREVFEIDYRMANPLLYHMLRFMLDPNIRRITNYGGSSSGKTYGIAQAILIVTEYEGTNTIVFRKVGASISKTVWEDFKVAARQLGMYSRLRFKESVRQISFPSGARIDFAGLDDPEKIKGISNYKRVFKDELSEFDKDDDDQTRKRLRGMEGQQIIDAFNPISETHWIKTDYIDKEEWHDMDMRVELFGVRIPLAYTKVKSMRINSVKKILNPNTGEMEEHAPDTVLIQTTYLNNFWVVGSPCGTFGFYDQQCIADFEKDRVNNPYFYNIYALGEWGIVQTGSEFFGSFERGKHCTHITHDPELPVHLSVDNNVLPYITNTFWQIKYQQGTHIRQIHEICAEPPHNSVSRSAKLVAEWLKGIGVYSVILHGDASTKAASTFDDEKRSWLDLYIEALTKEGIEVIDKVGNRNPSVAISGEFINHILEGRMEGTDILISEECRHSINDYMSVQKDANGGMLKTKVKNKTTGQIYEDKGHISDTARYFIVDVLNDEYTRYANLRKRNLYAQDTFLKYFNPEAENVYAFEDVLYILPDIQGRTAAVHGRKCGDKWHIISAELTESVLDTDSIRRLCTERNARYTVFECSKAYYPLVRDLRTHLPEVRVRKEDGNIDTRVHATSSLVRERILFDPALSGTDTGYTRFVTSLLDYGRDRESVHASACLSGFVQFVFKRDKTE